MAHQHVLHFRRGDVIPKPPDHVFLPAHEIVVAVLVLTEQVPRAEVLAEKGLCIFFGLLVVPLEDPLAFDQQLSYLSPGHIGSIPIHDSQLAEARRLADRSGANHVGVLDGHLRADPDFRHPVHFARCHAELGFEILVKSRGEGAQEGVLQMQVHSLNVAGELEHLRKRPQGGDGVLQDAPSQALRGDLVQQHNPASRIESHQQLPLGVHVIERAHG